MSLISQSPFVFLKHILKPSTRYSAHFQEQLPHFITPSYQQHHFFTSTPNLKMSASDATAKIFFSSPKFAVVGASTNTEKFGYKVFKWYADRDLPATPINPQGATLTVNGQPYPAIKSLSEIENPKETSVSIITGPAITLTTLQEAKELGVPAVWLQPGTFNDEVLAYANENFQAVVAGEGGWGGEGWCVLVDGERSLAAARL
ncbi:CoA binding domain-containing protein [Neurospora intermedia]|uniref:CoA binding domain-containing protein n=1 Tax=Neurospora intermedia TaxID=5142 RepID=A0ABR3DKL7_NEUIN